MSRKPIQTLLWGGGALNGERIELLGLIVDNFFPFSFMTLLVEAKQKPERSVQSSPSSHSGAVCLSVLMMCELQRGINELCLIEAAGFGFMLHGLHTRD